MPKIMHCASEACEHVFDNIRQRDRKFVCCDFSNHIHKQNRRFEFTFNSDLSVAKEDMLRWY